MNVVNPGLIASAQEVEALVARDTFDAVAARIQRMLSHGRPIAIAERLVHLNRTPDLAAGLSLNTDARDGGISVYRTHDQASLVVVLTPEPHVFSITTYDNTDAVKLWDQYRTHEADHADWSKRRREMVHIQLVGGHESQGGPHRTDKIVISDWNPDGVCTERVIAFDTESYLARNGRQADRVAARPRVNIGDLVVVPGSTGYTRSPSYRVLVEEINDYCVSGARIKQNGAPLMSRSAFKADPRGYVIGVVTWDELAKADIVADGGNARIKPEVK
jgi:hypothetical protein